MELFKGFKHDSKRNRVEPRLELEIEGRRRLVSNFAKYGFETEEEAEEAIRKCLSNNSELSLTERRVEKLGFISLPVGVVVRLGKEYDQLLSLLYIGGFKFLVCEDTENCLRVGDIVQSVEKGVTVNRKAHFWLYDKGVFPADSRKVYSTGDILSIYWYPQIHRLSTNKKNEEKVVRSPRQVYAWKPSLVACKLVFEAKEITENDDAMFRINLENNTFGINPKFDKSIFEIKQFDIFKDCLRLVSDDIEYDKNRPINLENLRNVNDEGYVNLDADAMCFVIEKKIKIRL